MRYGGVAHELIYEFRAVVTVVEGFGTEGIDQGLSYKQILQLLHAQRDGQVLAGVGHGNRIVFFVVDIGQVEGIAEHDAFGDLNLDAHVGADAEPNDGIAFHAEVEGGGNLLIAGVYVDIVSPGEVGPIVAFRQLVVVHFDILGRIILRLGANGCKEGDER